MVQPVDVGALVLVVIVVIIVFVVLEASDVVAVVSKGFKCADLTLQMSMFSFSF